SARVVPMKPAPPVIRIRLPCSATRRVYPGVVNVLLALATVSASLHITVWPNGPDGASRQWTLRCNPVAGTLPHRAAACTKLGRVARPFAPVPPGTACAEIYDGPQEAVVTGPVRSVRGRAPFARRDGSANDPRNRG